MQLIIFLAALCPAVEAPAQRITPRPYRQVEPVDLAEVKWTGGFWQQCLQVYCRPPSATADHRSQRNLPRLVCGRQSVGPMGQQGIRPTTHRRQRRIGEPLRQQEGRHQDGRYAVGRLAASGHTGRPLAAELGRTFRAGMAAALQPS